MNRRLSIALCSVGFVLGLTEEVLAWGPAMHIGLARSIFGELGLLPAALAALLARNQLAYIYGTIAADVVFAKRWSRIKQFCHHWSTAFRLLESSEPESDRAFAYGYLSHLAADTVAHGKYVPRQVVLSGCTVNFGHLYWELRADNAQGDDTWAELHRILRCDHSVHHHALAVQMKDTFLPYELNRVLFQRMNFLAANRRFRGTVDWGARMSRSPLSHPRGSIAAASR